MHTLFETIKQIAFEIDNAIKNSDTGYRQSQNASGEAQLQLDVLSDQIIENAFAKHQELKALISEEKEAMLPLHTHGEYIVCYDPLDGSSLVDVDLSVGSIFGIYKKKLEGSALVASAYVVYGPRLELVTCIRGEKPKHYRALGGKFNYQSDIVMGEKGKLNAPGGTQKYWDKKHKRFIESLFEEGYRLRYSGGMVPDLHQILLKGGGLFSYPGTEDRPKGKLRQLFEVLPFALIFTEAGGEAIDDQGRKLLSLKPDHPHDTSPCFFGSRYETQKLQNAYAKKG